MLQARSMTAQLFASEWAKCAVTDRAYSFAKALTCLFVPQSPTIFSTIS